MKIQDLFLKPIGRPIDGVIKADDERNLEGELEEYVFTREVMNRLGEFTDRYLTELTANGVWISGFFGSGKSHLLKMLSLLLDGDPLRDGVRPADLLLPKVDDEILRADLAKCASIPSRSIRFNIDQKFDGIGGSRSSPILEVFVKVLNEAQGYFGKQGYIAQFEYDLDRDGAFGPFKDTYRRVNGRPWETDRESLATVRRKAFAQAYAEHFGVPEEDALRRITEVREDYRVSIEDFAHRVKEYIGRQPAGFRMNFFVDEVGQFVAQDTSRMLNLQTLAETLGTVCGGKAWVFVTSQADLEGVLGGFRGMEREDVTKIIGRFKTRMTLASADVREVIQRRLLAKTEPEPAVLAEIYDRERDNLSTLFRFGDNSKQFNGWRGSDAFCASYPFHPYQFDLFQIAIEQLSRHNAFTGQFTAVGERSMLEVFQEAAKALRADDIGRLVTFDLLYDGISAAIRGDMQTTIKMAERLIDSPLAVRILKALFLLKWVREFKATTRNVAILLIGRPDLDIRAHEKAVADALGYLESQSYLQRNGDVYEFLTDTEKDIEVEIKNTDIDDSQVTDLLGKVLFGDVLRDPKIRYEGNQQDYAYARKLDDQVLGKDADVAVNVVTTENPHYGDSTVLAMHNAAKPELLAVLPADTRLVDQARLYLKTQKYIQQNSGGGDATRRAILDQRGQQNSQRRTDMQTLAGELLRVAPLYLNGSRLESVGEGDARNRFAKAAQELVSFAFPNLRMLKGTYGEATLNDALLAPDDLLGSGVQAPSEAEGEILTYVMRNQNSGERTVVQEMVRYFGRRPYGWYPMAVLTLTARLFRMGKVELRTTAPLDARGAFEHLKNSHQHANVRVRMQEQFDSGSINALKKFHHEFFDRANPGTDARSVAQFTAEAMTAEAHELVLLLDQAKQYPFLGAIRPVHATVAKLAGRDPAYLIKQRAEFEDELLTAKEDLLSPVKTFMHGAQRTSYDEALRFLREEEANFGELPAQEVQPLRDLAASPHPYRGNGVPIAKAAVVRLRGLLDALLTRERGRAVAEIDAQEALLQGSEDFARLDDAGRAQVLALSRPARDEVATARFVTGIRDRVRRYASREYPEQLALASRLAAPVPVGVMGGGGAGTEPAPEVRYTPASTLRAQCGLPYIATELELDQWLGALRAAARAELDRGNRISL